MLNFTQIYRMLDFPNQNKYTSISYKRLLLQEHGEEIIPRP